MNLPTAEELATYALAQQHPASAGWAEPQQRLRLLATEHELDVRMATDLDLATTRRDRFAPDLPVPVLLNSWEIVADDLSVMLSMRWEGGDPGRPFVDVPALSRALNTADDVRLVQYAAWRRFGRLGPNYLRWWSREAAGRFLGTLQDKRFLAAPVRDLVDAEVPAALSLRTAEDLSNYDSARAAYAATDHQHPAHPEQAALEPKDDLEELRQAGTLFDVILDGDWCGYLGVEPGHKLGLDGYKVAELVLTERARGRGLGRYLTNLLAQELQTRGEPAGVVIIGTIHYHNLGARRAAELAGRTDIGGWVRMPFN